MSKYRRSHVVWKNREPKSNSFKDASQGKFNHTLSEESGRSYFVSYQGGNVVYNLKHGDSYNVIPPINSTTEEVEEIVKASIRLRNSDTLSLIDNEYELVCCSLPFLWSINF